jgi:hypothetical protein
MAQTLSYFNDTSELRANTIEVGLDSQLMRVYQSLAGIDPGYIHHTMRLWYVILDLTSKNCRYT